MLFIINVYAFDDKNVRNAFGKYFANKIGCYITAHTITKRTKFPFKNRVVCARTFCAPLMSPQRQKRQPLGD